VGRAALVELAALTVSNSAMRRQVSDRQSDEAARAADATACKDTSVGEERMVPEEDNADGCEKYYIGHLSTAATDGTRIAP
jgi:hypothetical protein